MSVRARLTWEPSAVGIGGRRWTEQWRCEAHCRRLRATGQTAMQRCCHLQARSLRDEEIIRRLASVGWVSQTVASALCRVPWLIHAPLGVNEIRE